MNESTLLGGLAISLLVILIIFLLLREVWCWYWKINEALGKMDLIIALLQNISKSSKLEASITGATAAEQPSDKVTCPKCMSENNIDPDSESWTCENCSSTFHKR